MNYRGKTKGRQIDRILGAKHIKLGWNDARRGRWSDLLCCEPHEQLRYEIGRRCFIMAKKAWQGEPPPITSGKQFVRAVGYFEAIDLYKSAWRDMGEL